MSILSDVEIRELCFEPEYAVITDDDKVEIIRRPLTILEHGLLEKYLKSQDGSSTIIQNHSNYVSPLAALAILEQGILDKNLKSQGGSSTIIQNHSNYVRPLTDAEKLNWKPMISHFEPNSINTIEYRALGDEEHECSRRRILSYGTSSYGYDVRLSEDIKLFTDINSTILDPKKFDKDSYVKAKIRYDDDEAPYIIMPPHSFILGVTKEYFHIPRDTLVIAVGKSTYARIGLIVNVTPLEPEWEGNVVIEVSNTTSLPAKVYIGEGIAQFIFLKADKVCETSYADRGGKYQGQTGITPAKV